MKKRMKKIGYIFMVLMLSVSLFACGNNGETEAKKAASLIHEFITLLAQDDLSETVYVYEERNNDDHFKDYYEMNGKVEKIKVKEMKYYVEDEKITLAISLQVHTKDGTGAIKSVIESDKKGEELSSDWEDDGAERIFQTMEDYDKAISEKGKYGELSDFDEEVLNEELASLLKAKGITFSNARYVNSDDPSLVGSDVNGPVVCPYQDENGSSTIQLHYDKSHFLTSFVISMTQDMGFEIDPSSLGVARDAILAEFGYATGVEVNVTIDATNNHVVRFDVVLDLLTYDFVNDPVGMLVGMNESEKKMITKMPVSLIAKEFEAQGNGACTNYYK